MTDSPAESVASTTQNTIFQVLSNRRRMLLILSLSVTTQSTVSIRFLAEMIAVFETGNPPRRVETDAYNKIRQSLKKGHLQTLEAANVIEIDQNMISAGSSFPVYSSFALANIGANQFFRSLNQ